jgi:hypothetical protein
MNRMRDRGLEWREPQTTSGARSRDRGTVSLITVPLQTPVAPASFGRSRSPALVAWEYLIVALPVFEAPSQAPGVSASVLALNGEGAQGWEAIGMTALGDGHVAVLMKRPSYEDSGAKL